MYRQLYDWFRRAIIAGQLRPGQRVPSTRSLAAELKISRIPVLNAYEQLLAEGYLETFVGAGTCVASSIPDDTLSLKNGKARKGAAGSSSEIRPATNVAPWIGHDAVADAVLAEHRGSISSKLARARPFSDWYLVEAGGAACPKASQGHHGLWRCHGIPALSAPQSRNI